MSDRNRVKFYSVSDLSRGIYLDRIETILDSSIDLNNINDVIELFNMVSCKVKCPFNCFFFLFISMPPET